VQNNLPNLLKPIPLHEISVIHLALLSFWLTVIPELSESPMDTCGKNKAPKSPELSFGNVLDACSQFGTLIISNFPNFCAIFIILLVDYIIYSMNLSTPVTWPKVDEE